jgi:hypothetical protein
MLYLLQRALVPELGVQGPCGEKLVRERGAGSGEQGFHLQIVWNFDDHGEADLLPWIINV